MDTFFDYYFHETIFHSMDKFQQSSFYSRCNVCLSENQENRGRLKLARLSLAETVRETEIFRLLITIEPWLLGSPRPRETFSYARIRVIPQKSRIVSRVTARDT